MIEYFVTRKRWRKITEKRLKRQKIHDRKYWSTWFAQKIILEKEIVRTDKDGDIKLLTDEIRNTKKELSDYKKEVMNYDIEVDKLKNKLLAKMKILDGQIKGWEEVSGKILTQIGVSDSMNRGCEKLLNKSAV